MSRPIKANYQQMTFLPRAVEDWVGPDHPARFIREFVESVKLRDLGFQTGGAGEPGRPHYSSDLLLKVWLFGYCNGIRSSRKLERACREQMSLIWLAGAQEPDHNTLWRFWRDNRPALRKLFIEGVQIARRMGAVAMMVHALDGTRIEAAGATSRMWSRQELEKYEKRLQAYLDEVEREIEEAESTERGSYRLPEELADRQKLRDKIREALQEMEQQKRQRIHPSDPQARIMRTQQGKKLGYNAQAVVDGRSGIVVGADVVTDQNDAQMLTPMIGQVEENLGEVAQETVADKGYVNHEQLQQAAERGYPVLVAQFRNEGESAGPYHVSRFQHDAQRDVAICPRGKTLRREGENRKRQTRYRTYRCTSHLQCPVAAECSTDPLGRKVQLSQYFEVTQQQRAKHLVEANKEKLRQRKAIVERAFAEIKQHMGFRRWSVYGLEKVQAQWSLICLAYNLRRLYSLRQAAR